MILVETYWLFSQLEVCLVEERLVVIVCEACSAIFLFVFSRLQNVSSKNKERREVGEHEVTVHFYCNCMEKYTVTLQLHYSKKKRLGCP